MQREGLAARADGINAELLSLGADADALRTRWTSECALIGELEAAEMDPASAAAEGIRVRLAELQGESPMVPRRVDRDAIAGVVTRWTGIPVGRMLSFEIDSVLSLEDALRARVIGQDHAIQAIAASVQISRASLSDPRKPVGVFLLVGTSGVGKTETALALAEQLYGGAQSLDHGEFVRVQGRT